MGHARRLMDASEDPADTAEVKKNAAQEDVTLMRTNRFFKRVFYVGFNFC